MKPDYQVFMESPTRFWELFNTDNRKLEIPTEKLWKNGNDNGKKVAVPCHYHKFWKSFNTDGGNHEISTEK